MTRVTIEFETTIEVKLITETTVHLAVRRDKGIIIEIEAMKEKKIIIGMKGIITGQEEETAEKEDDTFYE